MSKTGIEPCSAEVMRILAIICSFVCHCNGKGGQKCVDGMLLMYNQLNKNSQILIEHPYYIPKVGSPIPLIPSGGWEKFIASIGRITGGARLSKTESIPQKVLDAYLKREIKYKDIREMGYEDIEELQSGELSIPDTVIVSNRADSAVGENVLGVGEIKFEGDRWRDENGQYEAATAIAGGEEKVHTLTPKSCKCRDGRQELDKAAGQAAEDLLTRQAESKKSLDALMANLAAAAAFVRRRNPVGAFFDILLTPTPAY